MRTLLEQAKEIAEEYLYHSDGFIFCNKTKAIFRTVEDAKACFDNYAFGIVVEDAKVYFSNHVFEIYYNVDSPEDFVRKLVIEMKNYCYVHKLEFVEDKK